MRTSREIHRIAGAAAIPFFLGLVAILFFLQIPGSWESPYLFLFLNTVFTGIIPLAIAAIAFRQAIASV